MGFIIRIHHDARSPERQISRNSFNDDKQMYSTYHLRVRASSELLNTVSGCPDCWRVICGYIELWSFRW